MACFGLSLVTWRSFTCATSRSVVESLASVMSRVWLTYWRVVFSLVAILVTERPVLISAQTAFWLWLRGEATEQFGGIMLCKYNGVYKYLRYLQKQTQTDCQDKPLHSSKSSQTKTL